MVSILATALYSKGGGGRKYIYIYISVFFFKSRGDVSRSEAEVKTNGSNVQPLKFEARIGLEYPNSNCFGRCSVGNYTPWWYHITLRARGRNGYNTCLWTVGGQIMGTSICLHNVRSKSGKDLKQNKQIHGASKSNAIGRGRASTLSKLSQQCSGHTSFWLSTFLGPKFSQSEAGRENHAREDAWQQKHPYHSRTSCHFIPPALHTRADRYCNPVLLPLC